MVIQLLNRFKVGAVAGAIVVLFAQLAKLLLDDLREGWTIASVLGSGLIIVVLITIQGFVLVWILKFMENKKFI